MLPHDHRVLILSCILMVRMALSDVDGVYNYVQQTTTAWLSEQVSFQGLLFLSLCKQDFMDITIHEIWKLLDIHDNFWSCPPLGLAS